MVSGGHICAPQRDINMASPYKALSIWGKRFPYYLVKVLWHRHDYGEAFCYLSSFISQILDFLYWLVCIFMFWWRDSENTELVRKKKKTVFLLSLRFVVSPQSPFCILYLWPWRNGIFLIKIVVSVSGTTQWRGSVSRHIWCLNIKTEMSIKWSLR